jgi:hypothetical protein
MVWCDYKERHPSTIPTTWDQLKVSMQHRFVPSYYACDLLKNVVFSARFPICRGLLSGIAKGHVFLWVV